VSKTPSGSTGNSIIVSGRAVPVGCPVRVWHETKLGFPALGARTQTRAIGLHWTGGYGGATQVHRTLTERRLSVQFCIDVDGVIWQYADATARASHIGSANGWCCGIEICNPASGRALGRETYVERVQGRTFRCSYFHPAQVDATRALVTKLCEAYGLPYASPPETAALPPERLATVRGVIGHFHVTPRKLDPGARLLRELGLTSS
jgi:N-acetyl-anhydromuramyl-L-alanine amidase AmpD